MSATFALAKGALLADEVGLGKTIEAGLVISQRWAERKRRILIIVPSNLRKQWHQEMTEKFFLPCRILETKSYSAADKVGNFRPFEGDEIVICSYQFARKQAADVANTPCSGLIEELLVNGSYVTAKPDPNDIDMVVVVSGTHDFSADLTPRDYNLLSKRRVRQRFGFDIVLARAGTTEVSETAAFFQQIRGAPSQRKGILRIRL
jgi:hypothetical protein